MLKILMLTSTIAFSGLIGLGAVYGHSNNDQQNETNHQLVRKERARTDLKKYATYNDESYTLTLTADELNDYTFENLAHHLDTLGSADSSIAGFLGLTADYNSMVFTCTLAYTSNDGLIGGNLFYKYPSNGTRQFGIYFNDIVDQDVPFIFYLYDDELEEIVSFEYALTLNLNSTYYNGFKTAIQADIDANQSTSMPSIADIFNEITSAVTAFVGSLGEAFESVTALFYDSTAGSWTFLGVLILIGVGVGLIYLAYRVIKGLMHKV